MQLKLRGTVYNKIGIDESEYSKIVYERAEKLKSYDKLIEEGCSQSIALEVLKVPRSTFYLWKKYYKQLGLVGLEPESKRPRNVRKPVWTKEDEALVLKLRKDYPLWGKNKIAVLLKRDYGKPLSVSTVGRILSKLISQSKVLHASMYISGKIKKPRVFNGHAQRWKYGMKATEPGQLIQIDHMDVSLDSGCSLKHFQAICPVTKFVVEQAYSRATSIVAHEFLKYCINQFPFKIQSIQVDGGSEFMGEFEHGCAHLNIPLYVLPPKRPQYNGNVERSNGTVKFEFYYLYDGPPALHDIRPALQKFVHRYNTFRPHQALDYLTPLQYYQSRGGA